MYIPLQGWRQDFPTGGLYNRTEGIFLSNRGQFTLQNFPTGINVFPMRPRALRREGYSPPSPLTPSLYHFRNSYGCRCVLERGV